VRCMTTCSMMRWSPMRGRGTPGVSSGSMKWSPIHRQKRERHKTPRSK
jgi:NADH:ubiquinone oxidoreductase subunit F (NADH-binding)